MINISDSNSVFNYLNTEKVEGLIMRYGSPCFIIDEISLLKRAQSFFDAIKIQYSQSRAAYSVKTQPLGGILKRLNELGFMPEVVSSDEFDLIQSLSLNSSDIIFNGPHKTDASLAEAISIDAMINCDHFDEIERISQIAKSMKKVARLGIRIADNHNSDNWLRFGFPLKNKIGEQSLFDVIDEINKQRYMKFSGLHCHIGTNIRDLSRFQVMATHLAELAEAILIRYGKILDWIDLGGGLAGISPRWDEEQDSPFPIFDVNEYAKCIIQPLKSYLSKTQQKTQILFEPGRTLLDFSMALLGSVVGKREQTLNSQCLITDMGIHNIPTTRVYRHPIYHFSQASTKVKSTLLGPSCMQHDVLSPETYLPFLKRNNRLLVDAVGAYNTSRNGSFIHLKPAIVLLKPDGSHEILREKEKHCRVTCNEID